MKLGPEKHFVIGDSHHEFWCDLRIFQERTDVEILHTGRGKARGTSLAHSRRESIKEIKRGKYSTLIAGETGYPYFNPRKNFFRNLFNKVSRVSRAPNLLRSWRFPYHRLPIPLACIDMCDSMVVDNGRFNQLAACTCYFKREFPVNPSNLFLYTSAKTEHSCNVSNIAFFQKAMPKIRPISLGITDAEAARCGAVADSPKKTDIFFAGEIQNRWNRLAGLSQLKRLKDEGYAIDIVEGRIPWEEFSRRSAQAYLVWSPEGHGWDCMRHYEIAAMNSVPLMQYPTIRRYAPMVEGEHAIYYHIENDDLVASARRALQNRGRLVEMARNAQAHTLRWHTHSALCRYVIEETSRSWNERKG